MPVTWQALHDDLVRLASAQGHARVAQVHDQGAAPDVLHDPQRNTRGKTQGGQAAQKIMSALDALHTDRFSLSDCAQVNRRRRHRHCCLSFPIDIVRVVQFCNCDAIAVPHSK